MIRERKWREGDGLLVMTLSQKCMDGIIEEHLLVSAYFMQQICTFDGGHNGAFLVSILHQHPRQYHRLSAAQGHVCVECGHPDTQEEFCTDRDTTRYSSIRAHTYVHTYIRRLFYSCQKINHKNVLCSRNNYHSHM